MKTALQVRAAQRSFGSVLKWALPLILQTSICHAQPGSLDVSFNPQISLCSSVSLLAIQPDGKVLFEASVPCMPFSGPFISRLDTNGVIDSAFLTNFLTNGTAHAMVLDNNGRIILGGSFLGIGGQSRFGLARLLADGTLDASFAPVMDPGSDVLALAVQLDGRILLAGRFTNVNGVSRNGVARIQPDGSLDLTFDPGTGTRSSASNEVYSISVLGSGKVLLSGAFTNFNGLPRNRIARVNADGSLDTSFDPGPGADQVITAMAVQSDGKMMIGGEFAFVNGSPRRHIARLNQDGSLDLGFSPTPGLTLAELAPVPVQTITAIQLQQDGRVLMGGAFNYANGVLRPGLVRFNPDGSLDYDLDVAASLFGGFNVGAMALQTNGEILVGGSFSSVQNVSRNGLARLHAVGANGPGRFEFSVAQFLVNEGAGNAVFTVLRTGGSLGPVSVSYFTADGTARAPARYTPTSGVLSFTNGEVSKTFLVPIVDDHVAENQGCCSIYVDIFDNGGIPWEVFTANLQNPTGGAVIGSQASTLVAIHDNDTAFSFGAPTYAYGELDGLGMVTVQRTGNRDGTNAVTCSTSNGTATASLDYLVKTSTLIFAPGEISKTFRFVILEDALTEGDETVNVALSNPTGGAFLADPSNAVVTILDQPGTIVSTLPGAVATNFIPGAGIIGAVDTLTYSSDGKLYVGGSFLTVDATPCTNIVRLNSDGTVDPGFSSGTGPNGEVLAVATQSDGKLLIGGSFTQVQDLPRNHVARLNPDGSLDSGFNPGAATDNLFQSDVLSMAIQSDGKIIVVGRFTSFQGVPGHWIARLNSDGSLDTGFDPGGGPDGGINPFPAVHAVALQADGKAIIAGDFTSFAGTPSRGVVRLNPDGSLDSSFNPTVAIGTGANSLLIQSDGRIVLGGWSVSSNGSMLVRLNQDGSVDSTFQDWFTPLGGAVICGAIQPDGKLLFGGTFTVFNGASRTNILRLNPNGALDVTFDPGSGPNGDVRALALRLDGTVAIGGDFTRVNGRLRIGVAELIGGDPPRTAPVLTQTAASQNVLEGANVLFTVVATGFPLPTFQWTFNGQAIANATNSSLMLSNVSVAQAGSYRVTVSNELGSVSSTASLSVAVSPIGPGGLDLSFYPGSGLTGSGATPGGPFIDSVAVKGDGRVLIGGIFSSVNGVSRSGIAQLSADASVDASFDPGTGIENGGEVDVVAFQPDGKVLVAGWFFYVNGTRIATIARLNSDGSLDNTFDPQNGAGYTIHDLVVQCDGKILIGGDFVGFNFVSRQGIARLNADGSLDPTFDPGMGTPADLSGGVFALALQNDGKVVMGGNFNYVAGQPHAGIARLNADGTLDPSFNSSAAVNGLVQKLAVQTDGKILLAGFFKQVNGVARSGIARLNADGSLDATFNPGTGATGLVWTMALQNYGRVLIGGSFTNFNGVARNGIARLDPDGSLDTTLDPGAGVDAPVYALAVQGDGRVIAGGGFTNFDSRPRNGVARLLNDATSSAGQLEFSVASLEIPENSLTNLLLRVRRVGGSNGLVQVNYAVSGGTAIPGSDFSPVSGTLVFGDGSSAGQSIPLAVVDDQVAQGNRTIDVWLGNPIGGAVWSTNAAMMVNIIDNDVALDFTTNQLSAREDRGAIVLQVRRLGSMAGVVSANYSTADGTAKAGIDYVAQNGTLTFSAGETNKVLIIPILDDWLAEEDETLVVSLSQPTGGAYLGTNSPAVVTIVDAHRPGTVDASFNPWFGPLPGTIFGQAQVNTLAVQSDGRILVGGSFNTFGGPSLPPLVRLFPDGSIDNSYQASILGGLVPATVSLVRVQPDDKALVVTAATFGSPPLMRLMTNGALDVSFDSSAVTGRPLAIQLQPDVKILLGGSFTDTNGVQKSILRLNADGSLDPSFSPPSLASDFGFPSVMCLAIEPDGKIVIGGQFTAVGGVTNYGFARLQANGALDATFHSSSGLVDQFGTFNAAYPNAIVVQGDGKLIVGGAFVQVAGTFHTNLARLNPDGSLDSAFDASAYLQFSPGSVSALALQPDGRILVAGAFTIVNGVPRNGIARLLADGSLDMQFHSSQELLGLISSSYQNQVYALALQPDGQVLIGGNFYLVDGLFRNGLARLNGTLLNPNHPELHLFEQLNGKFRVKFTGAAGQTYFMLATTNLVDWLFIGRPSEPATGLFEFEDPDSDKVPLRFYRVFSP